MARIAPLGSIVAAGLVALLVATPAGAQNVRSAAGANPAAIQATVDQFRTDLGTLNANLAGSQGSGRREVNWDGVPDASAAPNALPPNFFNTVSPRGVVFSTPGTHLEVSADASNPSSTPTEFAHIDPAYAGLFGTFSPVRLFVARGSTVTDVTFFVPGSTTPALTTGFGAVFTDVDTGGASTIQFFDAQSQSLGSFAAPATAGDETLSFVGVSFPAAGVARVRITAGNQVLAPGNLSPDLVVMDDFIFGEPRTDTDADGVPDGSDNCVSVANADQANADSDAQGDACDADDDNDGAPDTSDNCRTTANATQADADADGTGDACDATPTPAPAVTPTPTGPTAPATTTTSPTTTSPTTTPTLPCTSRRLFVIRNLRLRRGERVVRAAIVRRSRIVRRLRTTSRSVRIDLRRLPLGTHRIRVTVRRGTRTRTVIRLYRTCAPRA